MHHKVDAANIEASRGNVGGKQYGVRALLETVERLEPGALLHVALECEDGHLRARRARRLDAPAREMCATRQRARTSRRSSSERSRCRQVMALQKTM